jgi:hypothetical protein
VGRRRIHAPTICSTCDVCGTPLNCLTWIM